MKDICKNRKSLKCASEYQKLPGKLGTKNGKHVHTKLSEQDLFAEGITYFSEWGFSMVRLDISLVMEYLNKKVKLIVQFKENIPVNEWFYVLHKI